MTTLNQPAFEMLFDAYKQMAEANYRPAASSDIRGHVQLTDEQLADPERFRKEAEAYAERFRSEEDTRSFQIGCNGGLVYIRPLVYAIEASRAICGARSDLALTLLEMAAKEIRNSGRGSAELSKPTPQPMPAADTTITVEETE
jgi:hypothetical protein